MNSNPEDTIPREGRRRRVVVSALVLAALAALTIAFSSPLFAVLGFEFSALMALALSFVCGIAAIGGSWTERAKWTEWTRVRMVIFESVGLAFVPLVVSVASLPFLHNCSFWDGLLFYFEIAVPSAIFGGLFGLGFRMLVRNRGWAVFSFIAFWVVTLFLSLLPGYTNPQLFAYGWQYGFFPGFVWDEAMELSNAYLFARIEALVWVALLLGIAKTIILKKNGTKLTHLTHWAITGVPLLGTIVLFLLQDQLGITSSHAAVQALLSQEAQPAPNCTIYYAPGSLTDEELDKIEWNVRWYLHDIEQRFLLSPEHPSIRIYIYPSNDAMFRLVGTRVASIAKPWLGEVEIAKGNLQNLKHELTHVMLREKGVFPFYASWSTGVTEGPAMSVQPKYDGIYTLDEHAARILQLHYASGVRQIMSFSGFAANASEKSYVLAGSFSRYLLSTYGPEKFDRVYASLDWQKEYGKPLDSLQAEWKRWLTPLITPMDAGDSAHFRYYYDRSSIIFNPCLRRIGKLDRKAADAYREERWNDAARLYRSAIAEGGGIEPLVGLSDALLRLHQPAAALAALDTTRNPIIQKERIVLAPRQADLCAMLGDTLAADRLYARALDAKLSSGTFLIAYAHRVMLHSAVQSEWIKRLNEEYIPDTDRSQEFASFLQVWSVHQPQPGFDRADLALRYIYSLLLEGKGELSGASQTDPFGEPGGTPKVLNAASLNENDSLAISFMALHFANLQSDDSHCQYDLSIATNFCPSKYSRAVEEEARELNAEWEFQDRGTSPSRGSTRP